MRNYLVLLTKPSAFLPILMSIAGLGLVLIHVWVYGIVTEQDEGTPAHIFQLLIGLQIPIVFFFAANWLSHYPRQAITVLAIQALAVIAALAAVVLLTN